LIVLSLKKIYHLKINQCDYYEQVPSLDNVAKINKDNQPVHDITTNSQVGTTECYAHLALLNAPPKVVGKEYSDMLKKLNGKPMKSLPLMFCPYNSKKRPTITPLWSKKHKFIALDSGKNWTTNAIILTKEKTRCQSAGALRKKTTPE
jgi:hypothetical protein